MTHPEKYARPGVYLDEDDHGRLLAENREAYIREEAVRKATKLHDIERALEAVETEAAHDALVEEKERLEARLDFLADELEWCP